MMSYMSKELYLKKLVYHLYIVREDIDNTA
jgi:hypothetical protein